MDTKNNQQVNQRESFTCLCSIRDGFIYRPSTKEEAEEIRETLREVKF